MSAAFDVEAFYEDGPEPDPVGYPVATRSQLHRPDAANLAPLLTADEFFAVEDTAALVIPALGICAGPPTGLVGEAYVGKTIVSLSLGLSVAIGGDVWGAWRAKAGVWLHLDYEQGRRHTKRRVLRLARAMNISDDRLRALLLAKQIRLSVFPQLRLTTENARDHFERLFEGVTLVTCDSLRPMIGDVDENSSQVRALLSQLSAASDASGAAAVQLIHSGKPPPEGAQRTRKNAARGSSGIVDELQSMFVMTKKKGDAVSFVTHEKDRELGDTVPDFGLRIDDVPDEHDPKWGLRVVHVDRAQITPSQSAKFEGLVSKVRDCIRDNPGIAGVDAVRARIGGRSGDVRAVVNEMIDRGEIAVVSTGKGQGKRLQLAGAEGAT